MSQLKIIISSQPIVDVQFTSCVYRVKLLPSLFELKDNDTVVMSTIIKKLQDMSRNRSYLVCEEGKIVRLLLLSKATNIEGEGIISALKRVKT